MENRQKSHTAVSLKMLKRELRSTVSAVKTDTSKKKFPKKRLIFFPDFFPCVAPVLFHNEMEFQLVLTIFYHQKFLFRESSFHHLGQCFLAMPAVIPPSCLLPP
jgi:hypothetical protein